MYEAYTREKPIHVTKGLYMKQKKMKIKKK